MQALWVEDEKLSLRTDVAVPVVPDGEALVRVLLAGICNTDLELLRGYYPFTGILGHEFVGIVEQGPEELVNRRVVGEINASCGICEACREGRRTHCEKRTVLGIHDRNGAFAEFLTLPIENLHPIPAGISLEAAVFAEPLAAALEIQEQIEFASNDRVLVVGDGKLGQLIGQTLALTGCHLTVAGRHSEKLDRLAKRGIETVLATDLGARRFDIAVDCTGNPGGFEVARQALRPRGTLVLKSTYADRLTIDASSIVVDELNLVGSRCGPFRPALELLDKRAVDVESLIEYRYSLADGLAAFEQARRKGSLKVLLEIGPAENP